MARPAGYVRHELSPADHLLPGRRSDLEIPLRCIVRDDRQLSRLWEKAAGWARPEDTPEVERGTVVLATSGFVSSTGHGIGIDSVLIRADTALIYVMRYSPGAGCIQGALAFSPSDAVRLPPVAVARFHETAVTRQPC